MITMCFDYEIVERAKRKNKVALGEEELEEVEPEREKIQEEPMVTSINQHRTSYKQKRRISFTLFIFCYAIKVDLLTNAIVVNDGCDKARCREILQFKG